MTAKSTYAEQLERLLDSCLMELEATPDDAVLEGESPAAVKGRALKRLEKAAAIAGQRRLVKAKRGVALRAVQRTPPAQPPSPEAARAYIQRVAQTQQLTLAARKLDEMSNDDLFLLYQQILELEGKDPDSKP